MALFVSIGVHAPAPISPLLGLASHLVLFPVVAVLPAPAWARAGGYGWLIGDVVLNVGAWNMSLMGFGSGEMRLVDATIESLRQGIHVSAGLWIAAASWNVPAVPRLVGVLTAIILAVAALGGPLLPIWVVYPGYGLLIVWLALVGWLLAQSPAVARARGGVTDPRGNYS